MSEKENKEKKDEQINTEEEKKSDKAQDVASEDKKTKEKVEDTSKESTEGKEAEDEKDDSMSFSLDSSDEDLPEEIKQKLEKNKAARAKKKLVKKKKRKTQRIVKSGKAYIQATYNNTIVTLTDDKGDVISWASAGLAGFKGAKKATPYAAQIIAKIAVSKAKEEYGLGDVDVFVSGVGTGRESAIRALNANGLEVKSIKDNTPVPHNGCRPKKPRRV